MNNDLISREALKEDFKKIYHCAETMEELANAMEETIDNAPTVVATEDCISREGAINALSKGSGCGNVCRKSLETLPSVQFAERPHGKWVEDENGIPICSECNNGYNTQPRCMGKPMFEFCPICGAKMDGGEEE